LDETSGFLYGDSLYEVIFLRNGIPIFWEDHFTRMNQSADSMGMKITQTDNEIREKMIETIKYLGKVEGEVYVR
jgi:branched-subunit amino acid aminotransferase/4-amino-4-deoxychorismate lyase